MFYTLPQTFDRIKWQINDPSASAKAITLTLTARGSTLVVRMWRLTKVDPRTVRVEIFLMPIDPQHRYSNESERAN